MKLIIQTQRLYLRELSQHDEYEIFKLNLDPEVLKYTRDIPFKKVEDAKKFLQEYDQYSKYNMGRWAVCLNETDKFIGWCGLKYHTNPRMVEVGYRFYKEFWGKGYATESTKASIDYGFNTLLLHEIYAHVHKDNLASIKVIENCGLQYLKSDIYDGMPAQLFKITNPNYTIKQITAIETYSVRQPVLRPGKPLESCVFEGDDLESTIHLGLFHNSQLVGVATFMNNKTNDLDYPNQYQLRGMAVLSEYQSKNLGEELLKNGQNILKKNGVETIWCNAREKASSFYIRNSYKTIGQPFEIMGIGIHYRMFKKL